MKKFLIVICLIIGIGIVCEFGFNSYNPYETKCVEAGCNNDRVEGSIYCKNISQVKKILRRKLQKKQLLILTIIAVAQALTVIAQAPMVVQAPTVIAQALMEAQAHIVVALRKKAVHQLVGILHIVVVVLQVLHINLMMRDMSLYMMTTTMIGTGIIAIQTMLKV